MNDEQIIELYWQRDENAIVETGKKYSLYCFTVANNILSSTQDSEECVNDTWLRAWNSIPPNRPSVFKMFLAKITRNLAFDKYKSQTALKRGGGEIELALDELEYCVSNFDNVENTVITKEIEQRILEFLKTLSIQEKNIFLRRYFFVDSISEISKRYSITENNVSVSLSRTRKKLQQFLKSENLM